ncbi:hypothetical protein [Elizabethkingia meningoseptica]|uniref:hypothetical protein n=1 Tax=Elizabethkingia meningoseptica TaxID=238 RepID=UPI0038919B9D
MKEKFLELLNAKYLGKGVRKDGLEQLAASLCMTVTTEEEIKALVEKLTDEQVNSFINDWRKSVDSEVSKGIETYKSKNPAPSGSENSNPGPKSEVKADVTNPQPQDIATIVKEAVSAAVEPFKTRLDTMDQNTITSNRLKLFNEKIEKAPDYFKEKALRDYNRMTFKDDEDFDAFIKETETDLSKVNQEIADQTNGGFRRPFINTGNNNASKEEPSAAVKEYVADQAAASKEDNPLGGKAI